jgi:hypothetical protein
MFMWRHTNTFCLPYIFKVMCEDQDTSGLGSSIPLRFNRHFAQLASYLGLSTFLIPYNGPEADTTVYKPVYPAYPLSDLSFH